MAYLTLTNIRKSYFLGNNEFPVLKGINLSFNPGEFVSILGESGGGKTTLMNIIGGLDRQFDGQVVVDGKALDHRQERMMDQYRRETVGYIYQAYNLIPHLTVLDNVQMSLDMTTLSAGERKARALRLLEKVGLGDQVTKYPRQLSGGQKQRVAIARALAADPKIIIADEPTGALDAENTQEVLELLDEIAKDGKLVIAVTHSQAVAKYGTRIVHLDNGQVAGDNQLRPPYPLPTDNVHLQSRVLPAAASYRTAFKHFRYNFWRNSLIILGTAIGIFAVLLFTALGRGVNGFINDQINSLVNPRVITVQRNTTGKKMTMQQMQDTTQNYVSDPQTMLINQQEVNRLRKLKNVTDVEPGYIITMARFKKGDKSVSATHVDTWGKSESDHVIKQGHKPGKGELVLDRKTAESLTSVTKYRTLLGKKVRMEFNWLKPDGTPVQITLNLKVVGFTNGSSGMGISASSYRTYRDAFRAAGAETSPNTVAVSVAKLDQVNGVADKINNLKGADGKYILGGITVGSILKTVNNYVKVASTVLSAIAGISLLVSALMIIVTMYMSVAERTKEIGILRALGERRKDIRRLFTSESIIIGLCSAILAEVIAFIAALFLNRALYRIVKYNMVQLSWETVVMGFAIAIIISFVAALLPARRAARLNPIEALAGE
ncbi:ABC transporter ATP-binding protein/permease [uncultured Limosilactobacillus sp.]|uniref:ABC transporter ATP-binding protein/permease n=1 Tax=uncultured Limosilactobacillus sp. TaxID=2837629 RepID=UPI0025E4C56E|nr:ABC transporter ATP-binding protein/permease [uncultured Limosilactobacillus sp.]